MHRALRESVDEVLEKMFFAETTGECSAYDSGDTPPAEEIAVGLTFAGEPSGCLLLRVSAVAARQIAADFLGLDEGELSDLKISEVVRELANMICGSVLSRVESAAAFQLGAPQIVPPSERIAENLNETRYCVQLMNGRLAVNFGTGTPLCPRPAPSVY
ncbi:MAG: chemotaxis protein CheX [Ignavibacteriota bacterium]